MVKDSPAYRRHLLFRDYLRVHPDEAHTYGELKKQFALAYRRDRTAYTEAKTRFTDRIFRPAEMDQSAKG